MASVIGRLKKPRRRSYLLKKIERRKTRVAKTGDSAVNRGAGVVVVREHRRDPNWTEWTFSTPLKAANNLDTVELLGRDNDDPVMSDPS